MMIRGRQIVCIASSWFDHPTSKHHVMRLLSEENDVLWVNFHASRRPQLSRRDTRLIVRRLARAWAGPQRVAPRLDVLSPLLVPMPESPWARRLNAWILQQRIRRALRRLSPAPLQMWLFTPDVPELIPRLPAERVVYYCVDDFAAFDGFNTALMERLERQTLAASDVVITTSSQLQTERQEQHPRVHLVPHGVDFDHFARAANPYGPIPDDLRSIRRPILGYMGLICDHVDLDLVAQAARARPDWSFVMLGDVRCPVGAVSRVPNVHLLGPRPYAALPDYCRGFDVGLIPFRMNRLVKAVNPIKLREYLAAGLPVVSAPMAEVLGYAPAVQTAETLDEFLAAGERALELSSCGSRQERQELVRADGWRARVEWLSQLVTDRTPTDAPVGQVASVCDLPIGAAPAQRGTPRTTGRPATAPIQG